MKTLFQLLTQIVFLVNLASCDNLGTRDNDDENNFISEITLFQNEQCFPEEIIRVYRLVGPPEGFDVEQLIFAGQFDQVLRKQ